MGNMRLVACISVSILTSPAESRLSKRCKAVTGDLKIDGHKGCTSALMITVAKLNGRTLNWMINVLKYLKY